MADGDSLRSHVDALIADAEREAAAGQWDRTRALAQAALVLSPGNADAERLLQLVEAESDAGERRQLTVLFCDIVGSTAISSSTDPEILRDVLHAYQSACAGVVTRYDGYVANYLGDGIIAYFGYPRAHEDDAWRAVQAGLDLIEALKPVERLAQSRFGRALPIRIAIHTGIVVRAEMGTWSHRQPDAIVGEAPNVAARLQERARPGVILISAATYDLVRGRFECRSLGPLELRGLPRPVHAYEVRGPVSRPGTGDLTPFVGRRNEMETFLALWREAVGGGSVAALIRGEPGIGKSRLARAVLERAASSGQVLAGACSSFQTTTHLYAIRRLVEAAAAIEPRGDVQQTVGSLLAMLSMAGQSDDLDLFAEMLELPQTAAWSKPELDGAQLREATFAALFRWLEAEAARSPALILIEDVQWADPSTADLIGMLVRRKVPRVMLLLTARDGFQPPWPEVQTEIDLGPLADADLREMARSVPGAVAVDAGRVDELVRRSDGIPLFLEELARAGMSDSVASTASAARQSPVPSALQDALLARLSSPDLDLGVAQLIATVGNEADEALLASVTGFAGADLRARLDPFVAARLLERSGADHPSYRFHHQLLGQLAYETQLLPLRRKRHGAVAEALLARGAPSGQGDAGEIGYHLERAGRLDEAIGAYLDSARSSLSHGAMSEAIQQLDHSLELLAGIEDEKQRAGLELRIRQVRAVAAVSSQGYTSDAAIGDFDRCLEICRWLGPNPEHLPSLTAVFLWCLNRGDLAEAERLLVVERRRFGLRPADGIPVEAGRSALHFFRGDLPHAIEDMDSFLSSPSAMAPFPPDGWPMPEDPVIIVWSFLGLTRWWRGEVALARQAFARAEERAGQHAFPYGAYGLAYAKGIKMLTLHLFGSDDEINEVAGELSALGARHGFVMFSTWAAIFQAISAARSGGPAALLDGALMAWRSSGVDAWETWAATLSAEWKLSHGDLTGGLAEIDHAVEDEERRGATIYAAETRRVRGLIRVAMGDGDGVDDLDLAVEIARAQGSAFLELRAATTRRAMAPERGADADIEALVRRLEPEAPDAPDVVRGREVLRGAG